MNEHGKYVLLTAARNEGRFIEQTIRSVIQQTLRPAEWVIVSDSSTDATDDIVASYARSHSFIRLIRKAEKTSRNFSSKVKAIEFGMAHLLTADYGFVGNLDADVSLEPGYYEVMLAAFGADPRLGIVGGAIHDLIGKSFVRLGMSPNSVGGPAQFFRRKCWEEIGGYVPIRCGSEDGIAEATARMKGWKVRSLPHVAVYHLRPTGTEGKSHLAIRWNEGKTEYTIGYHPVFHLARTVQRLADKPLIIGSIIRSLGYTWHWVERSPRPVSDDFVRYLRKEELTKLKKLAYGLLRGRVELE